MEQGLTLWALLRQYRSCWCSLLTKKDHGHEAQCLKPTCWGIIPGRGGLPNGGRTLKANLTKYKTKTLQQQEKILSTTIYKKEEQTTNSLS